MQSLMCHTQLRRAIITYTARLFVVHHCPWRYRQLSSIRPLLPLVLCHGLLGFGRLLQNTDGRLPCTSYFRRVEGLLRDQGCRVFVPVVPMTASVQERAAHLIAYIEARYTSGELSLGEKVNLICHSMGGIDARYMITHLSGWRHVASCTTLSTPHRGSSFADWGVENIGRRLGVEHALNAIGIDTDAFHALTMKRMKDVFNVNTPDTEGVRYFSYAAKKKASEISILLRPSHYYIENKEGLNDGLVSLWSAIWGEFQGVVNADHYELINWRLPGSSSKTPFDAETFYQDRLLARLHEEGL